MASWSIEVRHFIIIPPAAQFVQADAKIGGSVCYLFTLFELMYCPRCCCDHQAILLCASLNLLRGTFRDHYWN